MKPLNTFLLGLIVGAFLASLLSGGGGKSFKPPIPIRLNLTHKL